jgi:hypothetical protein
MGLFPGARVPGAIFVLWLRPDEGDVPASPSGLEYGAVVHCGEEADSLMIPIDEGGRRLTA